MGIDEDAASNWDKENLSFPPTKHVKFESPTSFARTEQSNDLLHEQPQYQPQPSYPSSLDPMYYSNRSSAVDSQQTYKKYNFKYINDMTEEELYQEILELCSWYDPNEDLAEEFDSDEELEMIKRNVSSEVKFTSPHPSATTFIKPDSHTTISFSKKSSSYISLSTLRLSSSTNLTSSNTVKRRSLEEDNLDDPSPKNKRAGYTPTFRSHRKSSMNFDEAISCAAQNLDVEINVEPIKKRVSAASVKRSPTFERQKSEFWNDMNSIAF